MDRYLVINSDGHAGLPPERYRDYLDPQYRDEFDRQLQSPPGGARADERAAGDVPGERETGPQDKQSTASRAPGIPTAARGARRRRRGRRDPLRGWPDGERNSPPFGGDLGLLPMGADPELQWAGCALAQPLAHRVRIPRSRAAHRTRPDSAVLGRRRIGQGDRVGQASRACSGIMLPHLWAGPGSLPPSEVRPDVGGVSGQRHDRALPLRRLPHAGLLRHGAIRSAAGSRAAGPSARRTRDLRHRGGLLARAARRVHDLGRRLRALSRAQGRGRRGHLDLGARAAGTDGPALLRPSLHGQARQRLHVSTSQ